MSAALECAHAAESAAASPVARVAVQAAAQPAQGSRVHALLTPPRPAGVPRPLPPHHGARAWALEGEGGVSDGVGAAGDCATEDMMAAWSPPRLRGREVGDAPGAPDARAGAPFVPFARGGMVRSAPVLRRRAARDARAHTGGRRSTIRRNL